MALNSLFCADVPLRNYSHSLQFCETHCVHAYRTPAFAKGLTTPEANHNVMRSAVAGGTMIAFIFRR